MRLFDLKSLVWFQTKIALHKVQLPLYYIHFEITQFLEKNNNNKVLALVVAKFSAQWLFAFHFPEMLLITLIEQWNLIGCFVLLSHSH